MNVCCAPKKDNGKAYDLAIIGAGSAGFSAAITAADQGARVALIGGGTIGGTCVNVGCVPSKTLIRAAETLHQASTARRFSGISASARIDDWGAVARQKDDLVASLRQAKYVDLLPAYSNIAYVEGKACLQESGVLADGEAIAVIIATGARAAIPDILGIASVGYLTSTTALELTALPRSLLVIGGGYAGAELAQMFSRAGVAVTLVFRSKLLPEAESEIGAALQSCFTGEGMKIVAGVSYRAVRETSTGIALDKAAMAALPCWRPKES